VSENLVIIPTYNERENILKVVDKVFNLNVPFDILVVDDGSPDGTADVVRELKKKYRSRLALLERRNKQGLGTAYITGFKWGLERGYQYIYEMDADLSHPPEKLEEMYHELSSGNCEVVVGSRYMKGGKVKNWPFDRIVLSFGASMYTRMITWMPVKDPTAGFVGYTKRVLEDLDLDNVRFIGYAFQIEMKYRAFKKGFQLKEIPITFIDRVAGVSKLSSNIIHEAIFGVWALRFKQISPSSRSSNIQET